MNLLNKPETGMGLIEVVEASKQDSYTLQKFLVLNSEIVIEMNGFESEHVKKIMREGILAVKASANFVSLRSISVLNENNFAMF